MIKTAERPVAGREGQGRTATVFPQRRNFRYDTLLNLLPRTQQNVNCRVIMFAYPGQADDEGPTSEGSVDQARNLYRKMLKVAPVV